MFLLQLLVDAGEVCLQPAQQLLARTWLQPLAGQRRAGRGVLQVVDGAADQVLALLELAAAQLGVVSCGPSIERQGRSELDGGGPSGAGADGRWPGR